MAQKGMRSVRDAQRSRDRFTPLHLAASVGVEEVVRLLLERGAKPDTLTVAKQTPLLLAVQQGHVAVARLLLERGANPNRFAGNTFRSFLGTAAWQGNADMVRLLLEYRTDPNAWGGGLVEAAERERPDIMQILFDAGAAVEARDPGGRTCLLRAVRDRSLEAARLLLDAGPIPTPWRSCGPGKAHERGR